MTPARVLAAGVLWRLFGRRASARTLLEAFAADNEQNRMLAGISLVRAGQRSFDLIENEIQRGKAPPKLLRLLGDIDEQRARQVMQPIAAGDDALAPAARECIATLDRFAAEDSQG